MSWREALQRGKFRSAEFLTAGANHTMGRRTVLHEYPLRDLPYAEDMGRKAREYSIECFVLGDDYMSARDRLIQAIEEPGPGVLVHPYLGQVKVVVKECRIEESASEGGKAQFQITFCEAGENRFPAGGASTTSAVQSRADSALGAVTFSFEDTYDVLAAPQYLADAAMGLVQGVVDEIGNLVRFGANALGITSLLADITRIGLTVADIVRVPSTLAVEVTGLIARMASVYTDPARVVSGAITQTIGAIGLPATRIARSVTSPAVAAYRDYQRLYTYGATLPPVPTTTSTRRRQEANQKALVGLIRQATVIAAARAATGISFASYNEAAQVRDTLAEQLDEQMIVADYMVYPELGALRAAVVRDITERGADLARIVQYTPWATTPALVLAHRIYGDAAKTDEVLARNRLIRHPGFVAGNQPLEILADVA